MQLSPPQGTPGLAWAVTPSLVPTPLPMVVGGSSGNISGCEVLGVVGPPVSSSSSVPLSWRLLSSPSHRERGSVPSPVTPKPAASPRKPSDPARGKHRLQPRALSQRVGEPRLSAARCLLAPLPARRRRQSRDRAIMKTSVGAEAGERGDALQMRSWGSRGGSFMYDHVYVSDRL